MLFNEPKLLKLIGDAAAAIFAACFSALQRAEIAEIVFEVAQVARVGRFSALQRAEIAEIDTCYGHIDYVDEFQCSSTSRNC